MKILFFHPLTGRFWRGIERTVVSLASSMADMGHETSVLTLRHPERALLEELDGRVRLFQAPMSRYYPYTAAVPFFVAHLLRHRYDAIVVFFGGFGIGPSLSLAGRLRPQPVYLCPCYPTDLVPHRYDEIERWRLDERAAGIWAAGEHVARQAAQRFGRPVTPLPQGVDTSLFAPDGRTREQVRRELTLGRDEPVILTVANLEERKGIQHVLRALPLLREKFPGITYLVAGEGAYGEELGALSGHLGVADRVRFLGAQEHVERLYRAADLFCLLSYGEANPMVVYEALSSGLPLLTLSCPPFPDILSSEVAELLPDAAPQVVAAALTGLLSDSARRQSMADRGRRLAEDRYSFASLARLVTQLINAPDTGQTISSHTAGREAV